MPSDQPTIAGVSDYPTTLAGWSRYLRTYREGDVWAVWADEESLVQMCRFDGDCFWATPRGHMHEKHMLNLGWRKVS